VVIAARLALSVAAKRTTNIADPATSVGHRHVSAMTEHHLAYNDRTTSA